MLEYAKLIHEAIGIDSPRMFIAAFALVGLCLFGGIGWLIDKGYRAKNLQEQARLDVGRPTQSIAAVDPQPDAKPPQPVPEPRSRGDSRPKESSMSDKEPKSQSITVISHNQQGGITGGIVNVGIPDYTVEAKLLTENLKIDVGYRTDYRLTLRSQVVIPRLAIRIAGKTIENADMTPDVPAAVVQDSLGRGDGFVVLQVQNVFGPQILRVWTREPEALTLTVDR